MPRGQKLPAKKTNNIYNQQNDNKVYQYLEQQDLFNQRMIQKGESPNSDQQLKSENQSNGSGGIA